jgi:hypothetical protein
MENIITLLALLSGILMAIAAVLHHSYISVLLALVIFALGCVRANNEFLI